MSDSLINRYKFVSNFELFNDVEALRMQGLDYWPIVKLLLFTFERKPLRTGLNRKINPINHIHGFGEYGIMIGDIDSWEKGYAFEASQLVIDFCFNIFKLRKIILGVLIENKSAIELYKKIGFQTEGVLKIQYKVEDRFINSLCMSIFNPSL
jgi:RimJ/RimL family protein N-acetyltransferase